MAGRVGDDDRQQAEVPSGQEVHATHPQLLRRDRRVGLLVPEQPSQEFPVHGAEDSQAGPDRHDFKQEERASQRQELRSDHLEEGHVRERGGQEGLQWEWLCPVERGDPDPHVDAQEQACEHSQRLPREDPVGKPGQKDLSWIQLAI